MPLSSDPTARAKQLANLRSSAATRHGAYSDIRELRERHLDELVREFPSASAAELTLQAGRLAMLEQLGAFLDARGVVAHQRRGTVFPAAVLAERLAASFERQAAVLTARQRSGTTLADPARALDAIAAELSDDDEPGEGEQ